MKWKTGQRRDEARTTHNRWPTIGWQKWARVIVWRAAIQRESHNTDVVVVVDAAVCLWHTINNKPPHILRKYMRSPHFFLHHRHTKERDIFVVCDLLKHKKSINTVRIIPCMETFLTE